MKRTPGSLTGEAVFLSGSFGEVRGLGEPVREAVHELDGLQLEIEAREDVPNDRTLARLSPAGIVRIHRQLLGA